MGRRRLLEPGPMLAEKGGDRPDAWRPNRSFRHGGLSRPRRHRDPEKGGNRLNLHERLVEKGGDRPNRRSTIDGTLANSRAAVLWRRKEGRFPESDSVPLFALGGQRGVIARR